MGYSGSTGSSPESESWRSSSREGDAAEQYDGQTAEELARALLLPRVEIFPVAASTMDIAHRLGGEGVPAGTLVLADHQTAGRGRGGKTWVSPPGRGIWMTLIERPTDESAIEVLSIRVGMAAAKALDRFVSEPIRLKWPNDLFSGGKKVAGVLVEARWRDGKPEWAAIGLGVNVVAPPDIPDATGLEPGTSRLEVLEELVSSVRHVSGADSSLTMTELAEYGSRDIALGHECIEPAHGTVKGITQRGELMVALADSIATYRSGSLKMESEK